MLLFIISIALLAVLSCVAVLFTRPFQLNSATDSQPVYIRGYDNHSGRLVRIAISLFMVSCWVFIMIEWKVYSKEHIDKVVLADVEDVSLEVPPVTDKQPEPPKKVFNPVVVPDDDPTLDSMSLPNLNDEFQLPDDDDFVDDDVDDIGYKEPEIILIDRRSHFPGDMKGLERYLAQNIRPCPDFIETGLRKSRIVARFMVTQDGKVEDIKILKSVTPCIDKEMKKWLKASEPMWEPKLIKSIPQEEVRVVGIPIKLSK